MCKRTTNECSRNWKFSFCCRLIRICVIRIRARTALLALTRPAIITVCAPPIGRARTAPGSERRATSRRVCVSLPLFFVLVSLSQPFRRTQPKKSAHRSREARKMLQEATTHPPHPSKHTASPLVSFFWNHFSSSAASDTKNVSAKCLMRCFTRCPFFLRTRNSSSGRSVVNQ